MLIVGLILFGARTGKALQLSNRAEVSLITCDPGDNAATVYGHSAIRVKDISYNYDIVFNYGIYDFDTPNFLYRFASGQTDYLLAAYKFDAFVHSYKREKRSVYEQVLDLSAAEKQKIFDFLLWNARPENRVYRYNFFFDNCATRVRDVIADNVEGGLAFQSESSHKTLRRLIKDYHGRLLWLDFGIDFLISAPSDREAGFMEEMFLPDYVMKHFAGAIKNNNNAPLVKHSHTLYKSNEHPYHSSEITSPFVVFVMFVLVVGWISIRQFRRGEMKDALDYLIYGLTGFCGLFVAWFVLFSEHPAMSPNYNLMWLVPLNLPFALAWTVKKWRPILKYYHLFLSVWLILFVCFSAWIPQKFHPVFYLLVLILLTRSVLHSLLILRKQKKLY